jgi:hypothetical protein
MLYYFSLPPNPWKEEEIQERYGARLIRYADDFVVLCQGAPEKILRGIKIVLAGLRLRLNEEKTRAVDAQRRKMIGKPDSGKLNVRFDEGELEIGS